MRDLNKNNVINAILSFINKFASMEPVLNIEKVDEETVEIYGSVNPLERAIEQGIR